MSYLGRSAKLSLKAQEKVSFLATAGQTSKTGLSYTPTFVEVYVNGVLLTDTTDFTATNGNSITFTVALLVNDEVTVVSLKTFTVADHYNKSQANVLLAAKAPLASPSFTGNVGIGGSTITDLNLLNLQGAGASKNIGMVLNDTTTGRIFNISNGGNALKFFDYNASSERMRIDAAGIVTKPYQPIISVSRDNSSLSFTTNQDVFASTSMLNWVVQGISHNTSNGRFTVPVAGKYYVHFFSMKNNAVTAYFNVLKNGSSMGLRIYDTANATSWHSYGLGGVFTLAANDYLNVVCGDGATTNAHGMNHMNFTIHLIG
jgi:hypothetical protein